MNLKEQQETLLGLLDSLLIVFNEKKSSGERWVPVEASLPEISPPFARKQPRQISVKTSIALKDMTMEKPRVLTKIATSSVPEKERGPIKESFKGFHMDLQRSNIKAVFLRLCPSQAEAQQQQAYSDEGGVFLDRVIEGMKWEASMVLKTYLCPRPMDFIAEDSSEKESWLEVFKKNMDAIRPQVIICWGERLSRWMSRENSDLLALREKSLKHVCGARLILSWDPFFVLKNSKLKQAVFRDMKSINDLFL